jgi:hypothetical protein
MIIPIDKNITYDDLEDKYFYKSFTIDETYEIYSLNKIFICNCKSFQYNKNRDKEGCKHTRRVRLLNTLKK